MGGASLGRRQGATTCAPRRSASGYGRSERRSSALGTFLRGAPVEPEAAARLDVAPCFPVDERAVAIEQSVAAEPASEQCLIERARGRLALGRAIAPPDEHVAHALLELADVARPRIARAELVLHAVEHVFRQRRRVLGTRDALAQHTDEDPELAR